MPGSVLYIINHMAWFWNHRLPLVKGAKEKGWEVIVAAPRAAEDKRLEGLSITGVNLPTFGVLRTIIAVHKLLKTHQPEVVHAITLQYAFMAGLAARMHTNTQVVYTVAGLGYLFADGLKPRILRTAVGPLLKIALRHPNAHIVFQNPDDQELLVARGFVRPEQCHLIRGSGVDTEQFSYQEEPDNDTPIVVMPTRLVHDKGVAVFVEAARILKARGVDARFQIAGGVSTFNPNAITESEMKAMTADGAAEWLGRVSDMPNFLAGCNLVVYPSYYREGLPKVLLEACAIGRAIITTDHPGCREAVADNLNGMLTPIKDAAATAEAIEKLLSNKSARIQMGRRSRERAENEFDVRIVVDKTLALYPPLDAPDFSGQ